MDYRGIGAASPRLGAVLTLLKKKGPYRLERRGQGQRQVCLDSPAGEEGISGSWKTLEDSELRNPQIYYIS